MTTQITFTFDLPDSEVDKLIPCVSIYTRIYTTNGIVEVTDSHFPSNTAGYNATMRATKKGK